MPIEQQYQQELIRIGLTHEQATIYEFLLKNGPSPASRIARHALLKRGLTYKVLEQLIELLLVAKQDARGAVTLFSPLHPGRLQQLVTEKERLITQATTSLSSHLAGLVSLFNLVSGKPGISFFEGLQGIKRIYDDMLDTGKDILLIRSRYDTNVSFDFIPLFIKKRAAKGISVRAITPDLPEANHNPAIDTANLFHRTWVPADLYTDPVEIDIYGDKVAMIHLSEPITGTIIQHPAIAQAMRSVFNLAERGATSASNSPQRSAR
jgi:sugar-specific transcriptional regulator TrmB